MSMTPERPRLRIRIVFGKRGMLGPGKADLLEGIARTGSIAAAGREMGMSYKRAWLLVETMNAMFREPVVLRSRGGARGGGAEVTETGRVVLEAYRAVEHRLAEAAEPETARLAGLLREVPEDD